MSRIRQAERRAEQTVMIRFVGFLCVTFWLTPVSHAADPYARGNSEPRETPDEALLEFLGAAEELDDWNEFFDMAEDGVPPEFAEANDE